jgi:DNA-binding MarR family transcriptional regulator
MTKKNPMPDLLQHWREAVPEDRLAHLIRDVARAEHGVSFGHWTFLRILWLKDGLTQRDLSELAGVMEPTTFAAVKAMEGMGLVERRQLAGNRKNMHVFLTRAGRGLQKKLVPLAEEVNRISVAGSSAAQVQATRQFLLKVLENLASDVSDAQASPEA